MYLISKLLIVILILLLPSIVLADAIDTDRWRQIDELITDSTGSGYTKLSYQYFSATDTDTLFGQFGRYFSINPYDYGERFSSNSYLLTRMSMFIEGQGSLKTLTDTVGIYITNSNSDTVYNIGTNLVWGPYVVAGEDCTATTLGATDSQGAMVFNLTPNTGIPNANTILNARQASYPYKWLHVLGNSYGQHDSTGAGLDTVGGATGIKVLFRDIVFVPPVIYKCSSESDSLIYLQVKPRLFNAAGQADSIALLTIRMEGYKLLND